jgi:hypothetical protein
MKKVLENIYTCHMENGGNITFICQIYGGPDVVICFSRRGTTLSASAEGQRGMPGAKPTVINNG